MTSTSSSTSHNIVIIGGSFAGILMAHTLLRNIIPTFPAQKRNKFKVTMISPSTQFYFTLAGLRAVVEPELIEDSPLYQDFLHHFDTYKYPKTPNSGLHFVHGYATSLDNETKSIQVQLIPGSDMNKEATSGTTTIEYGSVIIASGAVTSTPQFKLTTKDSDQAKKELKELSDQVKAAKHIAVGGAGPLGCELVSDLAETYPEKKITLYAGSRGVMSQVEKRFGEEIQRRLANDFKIEIVSGVRVSKDEKTPDNKVNLTLTDGTTNTVDLYIPASGETPNTSFLPKEFLANSGYVETDNQMRVTGTRRVYALGDAAALTAGVVDDIVEEAAVLKLVLLQELLIDDDSELASVKIAKTYVPPNKLEKKFVITLGRYGGVAMVKGFRLPSFIVRFARAKDMGLPKGHLFVSGKYTV